MCIFLSEMLDFYLNFFSSFLLMSEKALRFIWKKNVNFFHKACHLFVLSILIFIAIICVKLKTFAELCDGMCIFVFQIFFLTSFACHDEWICMWVFPLQSDSRPSIILTQTLKFSIFLRTFAENMIKKKI